MQIPITTSSILFILALGGAVFGIYIYFRNPQEQLDKKQALDQAIIDGKAAVLAADLAGEKHATERRFTEIGIRMDKALELAQNHTHTIDVKCDKIIESVNLLAIQVGKLETKIDERTPRKVV